MATPREQLAEILKQARLDAGFESHATLAKRLNVSRPVVSKAENAGHPVPSDAILAAWAGATGVGLDVLTDLAERARSGTPDWFMSWRQAESGAGILRYWSPFVVPGIAQTRGYMRSLFDDEGHYLDQVDELIAARLERQQVIGRTPVTLVIGQAVLSRPVGTPRVMADIATSDGATTIRMSGVEDLTSTAPGLVSKASVAFERILGAALPRSDSLTLVRTAEGSWKAQTEPWKAQA